MPRRSIIICQDSLGSSSKFTLEHDSTVIVYKQSLHNQSSNIKLCDYLVKHKTNWIIFVELKGCDLKKAYEQIISTNQIHGSGFTTKYAVVVLTRCPAMDSGTMRLIKQLERDSILTSNKRVKLIKNKVLESKFEDF